LLIVGAVIVFAYHPFGKGKEETMYPPDERNVYDEKATLIVEEGESMVEQLEPVPMPEPEPELVKVIPEATDDSDPKVSELIDEAMELINAKPSKIIEARGILNDTLLMAMSQQQRVFVKQRLSELANEWLFSRKIFPQDTHCGSYKVKPGDQFRVISRRFKVPHEILMEINRIPRPEALRAGDQIKIINGPFHVKVYLSTFTMDLYLQKTFVRSFTVGVGRPGRETPTGLWLVEFGGKLISPTWRDPDTGKTYESEDPDYPLGSRWIGLEGIEGPAKGRTGFAFHGWKNSELMAGGGSRGCIRLHNGDVILLYNLLMPSHSQVVVVE
jgi:LysM repeat protein